MRKKNPRNELAVVGIGEVPTGWYPDRPAMTIALEVAKQAIADAGIDKDEIGAVIAAPALADDTTTYDLTFSRLVEELGLKRCNANFQLNAGGSTSALALRAARGLIASGTADTVLIVHAQQWSKFSGEELIRFFAGAGQYVEWEQMYGMTYNALVALSATRYMYETGTKPEHIAAVCVALRKWAELNPNAMFRKPLTIEQVLSSKMVATPFHAFECNVLADGGSAYIVTRADRAKNITKTPAYILGEGDGGCTHFSLIQKPDKDFTRFGFDRGGKKALDDAGIKLEDVDIAEIYMAYPHFHLIVLEELGFCKRGEAGQFVLEGNTWPGGKLPMTTNGEALSQGHTGAGVGFGMFVESVRQVMGKAGQRQVKAAEIVLETSAGGAYMDSHVTILGKEMS
jgi:acetyl-CoA C-acetyltransferase